MPDFKTLVSKLEDNEKSALFINGWTKIKENKNNEELTLLTERGWGKKVAQGKAHAFLLIVDHDEFKRLDSDPTEST